LGCYLLPASWVEGGVFVPLLMMKTIKGKQKAGYRGSENQYSTRIVLATLLVSYFITLKTQKPEPLHANSLYHIDYILN
jgi:hypothetical protein